ncbi:hypothetical protein AbauAttikon1_0036 [Acinetobacter phage Abau_Attikon1]
MDNSVSDRIQSRMAELKLSQADLMRLTGAARGTVSGWVNGSNNPSAKHIEALATALKTTSRWILTGKEKQNLTNFNMQEFMDKHGLSKKDESSFDVNDIQSPSVVEYGGDDGFIWIDVVEASFSCGTGESIEFHFDVINGKQPFPPSFFKQKMFILIACASSRLKATAWRTRLMMGIWLALIYPKPTLSMVKFMLFTLRVKA